MLNPVYEFVKPLTSLNRTSAPTVTEAKAIGFPNYTGSLQPKEYNC
jgi:hypothetical protein